MTEFAYNTGVARCDITPPVGCRLAGFESRNQPSTGITLPLRATALAIDDGGNPLLILSVEWLGFYEKTSVVRELLAKATGIPPSRIILAGTHTHCGPCIRNVDERRHGERDNAYVSKSIDSMVETAVRACRSRAPSRLRFGSGFCDIGISRRRPPDKPGDEVAFAPSPDGPRDPEVPVLAIEDTGGRLRSIVFGHACHPTGNNGPSICGDYVGFAYQYLETLYPGVEPLFLLGCAGDQRLFAVDDGAPTFRNLETEEVRARGKKLADSVCGVITGGNIREVSGRTTIHDVLLELATEVPAREHLRLALDDKRDHVRAWARHLLDQEDAGSSVSNRIPFQIQTIAFGDSLAMVLLAGEMTVEYGLRLKAALTARYTNVLVAAYCNHIVGYIPVERQIPEGGYEVTGSQYRYFRTGPFVSGTEALICNTVIACLDVAPEERGQSTYS